MIWSRRKLFDFECCAYCSKEISWKMGPLSVRRYLEMPCGISQWPINSFCTFVEVFFNVGMACAVLVYQSVIANACFFLNAVHIRRSRMSMLVNSNDSVGENNWKEMLRSIQQLLWTQPLQASSVSGTSLTMWGQKIIPSGRFVYASSIQISFNR